MRCGAIDVRDLSVIPNERVPPPKPLKEPNVNVRFWRKADIRNCDRESWVSAKLCRHRS